MLTFVADRTVLEIEGLGPEMAERLVNEEYVVNLADLFEFGNDVQVFRDKKGDDPLAEKLRTQGLSAAATLKMVETLERAKTASWDRWIAALGIPMIGLQLGKVLARELRLGPDSMATFPSLLLSLISLGQPIAEGIGHHKKAELEAFAKDQASQYLCERLHSAGVRPAAIEKPAVVEGAPLAGMSFCITGEMYEVGSREFITAQLTKLGATSKSGVSKKLSHLLVGTEAGKSKLSKAKELNIPTHDEAWLIETFKKYGVKFGMDSLDAEWAE